MSQFDSSILSLIKKNCKGKQHIKLSVGTLANGEKKIHVFNETGEIKNDNDIYEIGSITKTFTTSLMAMNIFNGEMSLDDSIQKYISDLNLSDYYPSLERLATHTAGYASHLPNSSWESTKMMMGLIFTGSVNKGKMPFRLDFEKMKHLLQKNKVHDKEYSFQYSNFSIALIGYAVGVVSGRGYWDTMNDFLANELGLKHTYTGTCKDKNLQGFDGRNRPCGNWIWNNDLVAPAGDISSTADDLLTYADINMNEKRPYLSLCHEKYASTKNHDMGLGWRLNKDANHVLWHMGGTGSFSSYLSFDKHKKLGCVVLSNYRIDPMNKIGKSVLEYLQRQ